MFSVGVQWTELERYLSRKFNREIIRVLGNGACFIRSVKHCLSRDLDVNYTIDEICDKKYLKKCVIMLKSTRNSIQTVNGK